MNSSGFKHMVLTKACRRDSPSRQRRHDRHRSLGCGCWRWRRDGCSAREIGEYLRRSAKRLLGVNDPIDALRGGQTGGERIGIGQMREIAEEAEGLRVEGLLQAFDEKAAEEFCERLDGEKEVRPPGDPARPIGRETAAWHDAMQVWMMRQRLPPCVQNSDDADLGAEPPRVGGERRRHRFGRRREQDRVDDGLVLERDGGDRRGQCEHDVEIGNRQKAPPGVRQAIAPAPRPDTSGNGGCGRNCRRRGPRRNRRTPRRDHRARLCDTQRSRSSRAVRRGPNVRRIWAKR